jgi:hypothetical protein
MTIAAITPSPLLQLTRTGPHFLGTAADENRLRQEFARVPCLRFASLLAPDLLREVSHSLQDASFAELLHAGIGTESCMEENRLWHQLNFLMNDSRLYGLVERITGCGPIGCFQGRVYRVLPARDITTTGTTTAVTRASSA